MAPITLGCTMCHAQSVFCGVLDSALIEAPVGASSRYGRQVAVEQGILAVSDYFSFGGVRVFRASGQGWVLEQVLERPERANSFGSRLAIDSGRIFVYAPFGRPADSNPGSNTGTVFAYEYISSEWTMTHRIDLTPGFSTNVSDYGHDIDAEKNHLLVSREGITLFYHYDGIRWNRVRTAGSSTILGQSVSVEGDRAVLPRKMPSGQNAIGEIWEFVDGNWSVTMSYELPYDTANSYLELKWPFVAGRIRSSGAVWLHEFVDGTWIRRSVEQPGWSAHGNDADLCFDSDYMYAASANNNEVVIFERETPLSRWRIADRISGTDFGMSELGSSVAASGGRVAMGGLDALGIVSMNVGCVPCPADFDGDLIHSFADMQFFLFAFQIRASEGDFDENGYHDFFDIAAFLDAYAAGCP